MTSPISASQVPVIRGILKTYKVASFITGAFLLLLVVLMITRYGLGADIWAGGPVGFLGLAQRGVEGAGLPTEGINVSTIILIIHGWLYVFYLFSDFRLWSQMRWSFTRFLIIAAGGVVPFLSFLAERHYTKVAEAELDAIELASPSSEGSAH